MSNIYQKLAEARKIIRETKITKDGKNSFAGYAYFTPEQVEELVAKACETTKTICLTNLRIDERGYYQELDFVDLEVSPEGSEDQLVRPDSIRFELRTAMPEIKATNAAQQMGGMDTYSERYLKMKVFQIKDNNLDFDAQDNSTEPAHKPLGKASPKPRTDYLIEDRLRLESTGSTKELLDVWLSLPQDAKVALVKLKEDLKKKYAKAGI